MGTILREQQHKITFLEELSLDLDDTLLAGLALVIVDLNKNSKRLDVGK